MTATSTLAAHSGSSRLAWARASASDRRSGVRIDLLGITVVLRPKDSRSVEPVGRDPGQLKWVSRPLRPGTIGWKP